MSNPITAEYVEAAQQCLRRAVALATKTHLQAIQTPQEVIRLREGSKFEAFVEHALENPDEFKRLLATINQAAEEHGWPPDPVSWKHKPKTAAKPFAQEILAVKPNEIQVFYQSSLESRTAPARSGRPDLLLWTGTKWAIIDFKSTDEAATEHALQLNHYHRLLKETIAALKADHPELTATTIFPEGFILHAAPPQFSTEKDYFVIHRIPFASGAALYEEILQKLAAPPAPNPFQELPVLISTCDTCGFRIHCHTNTASNNLHRVDRLHLNSATKEWLSHQNIRNLDQLETELVTNPNSAITTFLTKGIEKVRQAILREIAERKAHTWSLQFRPLRTWKKNYVIYSSTLETKMEEEGEPAQPSNLNQRQRTRQEYVRIPNDANQSTSIAAYLGFDTAAKRPAVIVCWDKDDTERAQAAVRKYQRDPNQEKSRVLCLQQILREELPVPLIAATPEGYQTLLAQGTHQTGKQFDAWAAQALAAATAAAAAATSTTTQAAIQQSSLANYTQSIETLWQRLWQLWEETT